MENEKPTSWGTKLRIFGHAEILVAVCAAGFALLVWNFERPPLSQNKLNSVPAGMSRTAVVELLGRPNQTNNWQWVYTRPLARGVFKVNFDDSGKVKNRDFDN
jgi:outer membrane protein assembly factor BamE (lipoprotein component of BamABCDE complex)